jgi:hypothetical protein
MKTLLPSVYEFPFSVEITDLTTNQIEIKYADLLGVQAAVVSHKPEDYFWSIWNRETQELVSTSHPNLD